MKWKWVLLHAGIIVLILVAGLTPLIATAVAGTIADRNGCELHEGFVNPCVIDGVDRGQDLYTTAMLGWLAIATVPIGVALGSLMMPAVAPAAKERIQQPGHEHLRAGHERHESSSSRRFTIETVRAHNSDSAASCFRPLAVIE